MDHHSSTHSASSSGPTSKPDGHNAASNTQRQRISESTMKYYAAALCGIILLFVIVHWTRSLATRYRVSTKSTVLSPFVAASRLVRRVFIRKIPGFASAGHATLVTVYVGINIALSFTRLEWYKTSNLAARLGWMATANLALVVFLSLKNTPLAILTSYSYERLNVLHQISGYATAVYMVLHAAIFTSYFIEKGNWGLLHENIVTAGIVLGFLMFTSVVEALVLRRLQYELFYIIHVILFIAIIVTLILHQPSFDEDKVAIAACMTAGLWVADRLIRICRLFYNGVNNEATISPLPNGGTQLLLQKPLFGAVPGTHCFVWLPKIRLFESHPFTIVAISPTELVVNSYSGFTKDLRKYAATHPGARLKVSLEGPYGKFSDPLLYDKVVLVAGGSGASFTFGIASNVLQRMTEKSTTQLEFIWAVKTRDHLSWFKDHLNAIRTHTHARNIALKLHTTRVCSPSQDMLGLSGLRPLKRAGTVNSDSSGDMSSPITPITPVSDKEMMPTQKPAPILAPPEGPEKQDDVRAIVLHMDRRTAVTGAVDLPIEQGRPDVAALIKEAVASVDKDKRVLIAACGPDELMTMVRNTAASCITRDGPSVELHIEQFGW
ncbi:ferric reductase like transmembrane component [Pseudomassariella vexata]|uniref:Ferric reductase like transmembrane component n=1 Tax=Pseudomassariella vexata TaxID=1141098 RepID=A0A1Y2DUS1_9PEZI|nr:ferric reductase like transmembrane component [Pseudomassariella vexata]ORY62987.1 ferric reductase like transmembrane component [Pseudomassariella vexata]